MKESDNTPLKEINILKTPNTKSMLDRYLFASAFCYDKEVLDVACGVGYGTALLKSLGAKNVVGADIDTDAIVNASNRYGDFVEFVPTNVTVPWTTNDTYDVVVSLETFEHVPRETVPQMLKNFKQVVRKGGKVIISTPRRRADKWEYMGGTHLYEYSVSEFLEELRAEFDDIKLFYAMEFRHISEQLHASFTDEPEYADKCRVMMAVITVK